MVRTDPPLVRLGATAAARPGPRTPRREDVVPLVLLAALPVLIFGVPALFGHAVVPGDDMTQNLPLRELVGSDIRAGRLPLFDPYTWSGAALLAGWNAAAAYPLTWLFAVLPGTAAWTAGLIATWAAAGLGMFCFLRALRLGSLASFLGALSFAFAGAMPAQVTHFGLVAGISWVPLALLAVLRLTQDRAGWFRPGWTAVLAVSIGLVILAGEPRAIDDAGVIVAIYAAWRIARLGRRWFPAAVSVAAGLLLGVCLGAVQWLPGVAAVATSQRAADSAALFDSGSLPVRWLLLTLVPDLLGGSGSLSQPAFFAGYNLTEVTSYAGVLPLVAAFALLGRLRIPFRFPFRLPFPRRRPAAGPGPRAAAAARLPEWLVWHVVALAGVVLALGGNTPLGGLLSRLPLFGGQRLQSRNILVLDLALAVLLAYWVSRPVSANRLRRRRETILGLVPALAVVAVVVIAFAQGPALLHSLDIGPARAASVLGRLRPWLVPYAVLGAVAAVLVIVGRRLGRRPRGRLIAWFVVTDVVVFILLSVVAVAPGHSGSPAHSGGSRAASGTGTGTGRVTAVAAPPPPSARPAAALGYQGRFAIYDPGLLDAGELSALDPPDRNTTGPGTMPSVQGYSSLADGRYAAATGTHQATGEGQDTLSPQAVGDGTLDQLDTSVLLTLRAYLITTGQASQAAAGPAGTGQRDIAAGQRTTWYLGSPLPVSRVTVPDPDARQDAATGTQLGLVAPDGRTNWFAAHAASASTLAVTPPAAMTSIAVTARAGSAGSTLGPPAVASAGGGVFTANGQLQDALVPPRWEYAGLDGSFAVYANRLARGPLTIQPLPGRSARGAWIKATSGAPAAPETAAVFTPHGATIVRSVAAIPGWSAAWHPDNGPAVPLSLRVDGLVQAVDVPPGHGTLTWSYTPPHFGTGFGLSAVAVAAVAALAALSGVAGWSRRRRW